MVEDLIELEKRFFTNRDVETLFSRLFGYNEPGLRSVAIGILGNVEDTEDCVAMTRVKAWKSRHAWRGDARFSTWIYAINRFTALSMLREKKMQRLGENLTPYLQNGYAPVSVSAEFIAVQAFLQHTLSPKERFVIYCRRLDEMARAQVAGLLGVPEAKIVTIEKFAAAKIFRYRPPSDVSATPKAKSAVTVRLILASEPHSDKLLLLSGIAQFDSSDGNRLRISSLFFSGRPQGDNASIMGRNLTQIALHVNYLWRFSQYFFAVSPERVIVDFQRNPGIAPAIRSMFPDARCYSSSTWCGGVLPSEWIELTSTEMCSEVNEFRFILNP